MKQDPTFWQDFSIPTDLEISLDQETIKQLLKDQRRLNWLDKNFGENVVSLGKKWYVRKGPGYPHVKSPSIRTAIDSASKE